MPEPRKNDSIPSLTPKAAGEGGGVPPVPPRPRVDQPVPAAPAPDWGRRAPRAPQIDPARYKEASCARCTLGHSETPRKGGQKAWGGIYPPTPGLDSSPTQPHCGSSCSTHLALGGRRRGGGTWWVIWRGGTQGRERGGEQPPELQRANSSPKGEFRSRRSRVSSRLALQPWKASLAGTRSVSPRSWRPPRAARSL